MLYGNSLVCTLRTTSRETIFLHGEGFAVKQSIHATDEGISPELGVPLFPLNVADVCDVGLQSTRRGLGCVIPRPPSPVSTENGIKYLMSRLLSSRLSPVRLPLTTMVVN